MWPCNLPRNKRIQLSVKAILDTKTLCLTFPRFILIIDEFPFNKRLKLNCAAFFCCTSTYQAYPISLRSKTYKLQRALVERSVLSNAELNITNFNFPNQSFQVGQFQGYLEWPTSGEIILIVLKNHFPFGPDCLPLQLTVCIKNQSVLVPYGNAMQLPKILIEFILFISFL